ncbi:MAG: M50 family metallopeptidase [Christensenellaceae bacterium]
MLNILSVQGVLQTAGSIVVALLVLLATITVHEFGHYIVGKIFKFKINEFSIGMGPRIFKKVKKNGEVFSIRILPLGGFCAFEGEDEDASTAQKSADSSVNAPFDEFAGNENTAQTQVGQRKSKPELSKDAFNNKKPYQRILVLIAGATMNFIFAIFIIFINFASYGHFVLKANEVVAPKTEQEQAYCLQNGDRLVAIENTYLYLTTDISKSLAGKSEGDEVRVSVVNEAGEKITRTVKLKCDVKSNDKYSYIEAFQALGIATSARLTTAEGSPFKSGSYLLKANDREEYDLCTRIYDNDDFVALFADKNVGDSVSLWVNESGVLNSDSKSLITVKLSDEWADVDVSDLKSVKAYFKIEQFSMYYSVDSVNVRLSFGELTYRPIVYSFKNVGATFEALGDMFTGSIGIESLSGPIGTVAMTSQYVKHGLNYLLEIMGLIGISIGIFNLLPIPALDGARAVFVLIEWIRKKPINRRVEGMIHTIGLFALLGFAILVDLLKLFI